jgi:hypothetical protein
VASSTFPCIAVCLSAGLSTTEACKALYGGGGLRRFYAGLSAAVLQGPLSRFGDTASNAAIISYLESTPATRSLPVVAQTLAGSVVAAAWRMVIMPLDVCKTIAQVRGAGGMAELRARVQQHGPSALWRGSSAAFVATLCGHLPWYSTFNFLNRVLPHYANGALGTATGGVPGGSGGSGGVMQLAPQAPQQVVAARGPHVANAWKPPAPENSTTPPREKYARAARHGVIGFCSSVVSDCCTNSLRVVKAIRQSENLSYRAAAKLVVEADGLVGLFGRGLKTRIMANGCQGLVFTALWKALEDAITEHRA